MGDFYLKILKLFTSSVSVGDDLPDIPEPPPTPYVPPRTKNVELAEPEIVDLIRAKFEFADDDLNAIP